MSNQHSKHCTTFMYTALPCEAKPLVEHFRLKKDLSVRPFAVYRNEAICLTVTGIGKSAMAAGVAFSQALMASVENPVLVNIGIAGHRSHAVGEAFLIEKIIDNDSLKNCYPPIVFKPSCPTEVIRTASKPQTGYDHPDLSDMEASAFFETATRFSSGELVQCLKVVSDNQSSPAAYINPQQVSALINQHIPSLEALLAELNRLAEIIILPESNLFNELVERYRFTANEQSQLKNQLRRWDCLTDFQPIEFNDIELHRGKDVLNWLEEQIGKRGFSL